MASGQVNRIKRPNTWLHRPMLQNVKKLLPTRSRPHMARIGGQRAGRACPLCPGISDINLSRYCQSISTSIPRYLTVLSILVGRAEAGQP
jgi:hypothetical protein